MKEPIEECLEKMKPVEAQLANCEEEKPQVWKVALVLIGIIVASYLIKM